MFKLRKILLCLIALGTMGLVSTAQEATASTLTFGFSGDASPNPGAPGDGITSGFIVMDTTTATLDGTGRFLGAVTDIDIDVNGVAVKSQGTATLNRLNQENSANGRDNLFLQYIGGFAATGASYEVEKVRFDLRFNSVVNIFDDTSDLFSDLSGGDRFGLDDLDYASLTISYDSGISDTTILLTSRFDTIDLSYDIAAVPLPAGLPLMLAGIAALGIMRRRQTA